MRPRPGHLRTPAALGYDALDQRENHAAADLIRRRLGCHHVPVDDATRPLYRELVAAGLMILFHSFARGNEGAYRLTEAAYAFRTSRSSGRPATRGTRRSPPASLGLHPPKQFPRSMADRQLRLQLGDQSQLVVAAVLGD